MNARPTTRTAIRTCPLCEATCGLSITLQGEQVVRIEGDRHDVFSQGYLCPKGASLGATHTDPDRLTAPVIRRNGRFEPVGWDEAFAEVERLFRPILDTDGPHSVAVYLGNPIGHNLAGLLYPRVFLKALGSRNLYTASTLDQRPKDLVNALLYGERYTLPVPDIDRTQFLVVIGANPIVSNGSLATAPGWPRRLDALRARGGTLVVIDPVRTQTAERADQHIAPRVGSDAALLASVVHVLFEEQLVRLGRLDSFVRHTQALREAVAPFPPEATEAYTGVAAEVVRALARAIAAAPSACVYGRMGTTTTAFGSLASWFIDAINILTGNLDRAGGSMFPLPASGSPNTRGLPGRGKPVRIGRFHTRVRQAPELFGEFPTSCLAEEIDTPGEGRYRALLLVCGNPVVSSPDSQRMSQALSGLEALVAVDPYINDSTRHAHVILPPPSALQRSHYDVHFTQWSVRNVANYSPAALPLGEGQLDEWEIMCRLASAIDGSHAPVHAVDQGLIEAMIGAAVRDEHAPIHGASVDEILAGLGPQQGPERILDYLLRVGPYGDAFGRRPAGLTLDRLREQPHGIDLGALQPRLPEVLRSVDGLIDLAPALLVADLDRLSAALRAEPQRTGLTLVGRRHLRSNNSWMHNAATLVSGRERCTLQMNPQDADERGLEPGDSARVRSRTGEVVAPVEVSDRLPRGVVSLPHGWAHEPQATQLSVARQRPGVNSNRLGDTEAVDAPSWNAVLNGIAVDVVPAHTTQPDGDTTP